MNLCILYPSAIEPNHKYALIHFKTEVIYFMEQCYVSI